MLFNNLSSRFPPKDAYEDIYISKYFRSIYSSILRTFPDIDIDDIYMNI